MLKIRLQRFGKKNQPSFRVVLVDSQRAPKSGNFKEILGSYNPATKEMALEKERITHWIGNGAQLSDRMHNLLVNEGVITGKKRDVSSKKNVGTKEEEGNESASQEQSPDAEVEEAPADEGASEVKSDSEEDKKEEEVKEEAPSTEGEKEADEEKKEPVEEKSKEATPEETPEEPEKKE